MRVYLIQLYNRFNRRIMAVVAETEEAAVRTCEQALDAAYINVDSYSTDVIDSCPVAAGQFIGTDYEV